MKDKPYYGDEFKNDLILVLSNISDNLARIRDVLMLHEMNKTSWENIAAGKEVPDWLYGQEAEEPNGERYFLWTENYPCYFQSDYED